MNESMMNLADLPTFYQEMTFYAYNETSFGKPFSAAGVGMRMRGWCDQAGLPHCSGHGLRKAAATIAAMNGATAHQLMSIFGWTTLQQAEVYTRAADQMRLANASMHMLLPTEELLDPPLRLELTEN